MIKLIRHILGLCDHNWFIMHQFKCETLRVTDKAVVKSQVEYHQQCHKCGKLRKTTL